MTDEELLEELTALAEDFDSLSDDARDDELFIYDWEPPEWLPRHPERGGTPHTHPDFNVWNYVGLERAVVIAAVLREAIRKLK